MPQTTDAISWVNAKVEIKVFGGSFVDIGGSSNKLEVDGFERIIGEAFSQIGDAPIVTAGKKKSGKVKFQLIYTETTGEAWKTLYDAYQAGTKVQGQWTPKGSGTGAYQYTTEYGYLENVTPPTGESEKGDPILCEATLVTASYSRAALA